MVTTPDTPFLNIRGTSETHFRIGLNGPTIYFGDTDPTITPPTAIPDGFKDGDLYIRIQTGSETIYIRQSGTFTAIATASTGANFSADVSFDTGAQLILDDSAGAASPALAFDNDLDTGVFRGGANEISFSTSGLSRFSVQSDGTLVSNTASYESLVTADNDIPNRKFVLDNAVNSGGDTITGDITFLGGDLLLDSGSAADPSLAFSATPTTGIYTTGANDLNISANGTTTATFNSSGLSFASGSQLLLDSSSAIAPGLAASNDTNTGLFFDASLNTIGFSTNATERARISDTSISSTIPIRGPSGSAANPSLSFTGDTDAGFFTNGNSVKVSVAGTERFTFEADGTLSASTAGYEGLVSSPNDIPNRQFIQDTTANPNSTAVISGNWSFTAPVVISSISPELALVETDATADNGKWKFIVNANSFSLQAVNDLEDTAISVFDVNRTGTTVNSINFPTGTLQNVGNDVITTIGGSLTNFLTLHADPVNNLHAATKQYVDSVASGGTGSNADTLDGLDSTSFLRSNVSDDFTGTNFNHVSISPIHKFEETDATVDNGKWRFIVNNDIFSLQTLNDLENAIGTVFDINRTGTTVDTINFPTGTLQNTGNDVITTTGGTFTNFLTLHADPTNNLHAATKQYVDSVASGTTNADTLDGLDSTSFLRSDTSDTFTGSTFSHASISPIHKFEETDATADNGKWRFSINAETFSFEVLNDAENSANSIFDINRTGTTVNTINFPTGTLQNTGNDVITTSGGTFTNFLTLHADPTNNLHAATKQYVDSVAGGATNADTLDGLNSTSFLRSDISDSFTGSELTHNSAAPVYKFIESDATIDNRRWRFIANAERFSLQALNDAESTIESVIDIDRTGTTVDTVNITSGSFQYLGDNVITSAGGTLTQFLTLHADPTNNLHAATKQYVDNVASGLTGFATDEFTATEGQTIFNTSNVTTVIKNSTTSFIKVFLNGVLQREGLGLSYRVTGSNQITFNTQLSAGDEIVVFQF